MVNAPPLRVVFFGTPEFAVPTLSALISSRHSIAAVVTQPDRPRGRGHRMQPPPVKVLAESHGISVLQPARLRDAAFLTELTNLAADIGVVAAYGKILTDVVLTAPRLGMVNVHGSLLPRYRGAAPVHRAVMAGESETGVTIMRVVQELDAGPMLQKVSRHIGDDDTSEEVERDLAQLGAVALVEVLDRIAAGAATETPQDDSAATYAHKIQKADGVIDWLRPARAIHNQIRGLHPWPHAFTDLDNRRCLILQSKVEHASATAAAGTVIKSDGDDLLVQTGDGVLRILQLQLEGRKPLRVREFLSGHPIAPGTRFTRSHVPE